MLPCVCSVCQNVVRTSVTHSAVPRMPLFCSYHILLIYSKLHSKSCDYLYKLKEKSIERDIGIITEVRDIKERVSVSGWTCAANRRNKKIEHLIQ